MNLPRFAGGSSHGRHRMHGPAAHRSRTGGRQAFSWFSYSGLFLLAALVLGGGNDPRLTTDFLLQLLAIPFVWQLLREFPHGVPQGVVVVVVGILLLFAWQLMPWPGQGGLRFPHTLDAGRTLHSAMIVLVAIAFFHHVLKLPQHRHEQLVLWFLTGVALNFLLATLQFASSEFTRVFQPFSWPMKAGFFANENHLSLLFVLAVVMIIALFRHTRWPLLSLPVVLLILLFQFVVSSIAGIVMIFLAIMAGYSVIFLRGWKGWAVALALMLVVVGMVLQMPQLLEKHFWSASVLSRYTFMRNTLAAIGDHLPAGSGFGTFTLVYPKYESLHDITEKYVNHVHNDWLELMLEGGLPVVALVLAALFVLAHRVFSHHLNHLQKASLLGVGMMFLHSVVDYPLRTMALLMTLAWLLGMIFHRPHHHGASSRHRHHA